MQPVTITKSTRTLVNGAPSQIPTLKFLPPPPQHPQVPPLGHDPSNRMKIMFNMVFIFHFWEHTQSLVKKMFEIDIETVITVYMIHDLLTSPKCYQFDPRMTSLLAFYSARHPRRFDMPHDHVWKKWPPWVPQRPKVPTQGHDPDGRIKIQSDMFCIFQLW